MQSIARVFHRKSKRPVCRSRICKEGRTDDTRRGLLAPFGLPAMVSAAGGPRFGRPRIVSKRPRCSAQLRSMSGPDDRGMRRGMTMAHIGAAGG